MLSRFTNIVGSHLCDECMKTNDLNVCRMLLFISWLIQQVCSPTKECQAHQFVPSTTHFKTICEHTLHHSPTDSSSSSHFWSVSRPFPLLRFFPSSSSFTVLSERLSVSWPTFSNMALQFVSFHANLLPSHSQSPPSWWSTAVQLRCLCKILSYVPQLCTIFHWLVVSVCVRLFHLLHSSVYSHFFVGMNCSFHLSIDHSVLLRCFVSPTFHRAASDSPKSLPSRLLFQSLMQLHNLVLLKICSAFCPLRTNADVLLPRCWKGPPCFLDTLLRRSDFFPNVLRTLPWRCDSRVLGSRPWLFSLLVSMFKSHVCPSLHFFFYSPHFQHLAHCPQPKVFSLHWHLAAASGLSRSSLPAALSLHLTSNLTGLGGLES